MKSLLLILAICLPVQIAFSQSREDKIEAAKIGFLTTQLNLSEVQAREFWPVYNEFAKKRRSAMEEMKSLLKVASDKTITDEQARIALSNYVKLRQQEVDSEKDFQKRVLKAITPSQLVTLYAKEREFHRILLGKSLRGRRHRLEGEFSGNQEPKFED